MKRTLSVILMLTISLLSFGQKTVTWKDLADVTFEKQYLEKYDMEFLQPNFSSSIKELEGEVVSVTGYFINIDPTGEFFILSREPMASCFHCGGAGPESAIQLNFAPSSRVYFKTDDIITITGVFSINEKDMNQMNYILSNARGRFAQR